MVIKNYFRDKSRMVKLPRRLSEVSTQVKKYAAEYESKHGVKPSVKAIAEDLGLLEEEVVQALEVGGTVSLDSMATGEDGENSSLYSMIADGEDKYENFEIKEKSKFDSQELKWNSPWGVGYPGWHIECSTMSMKYLGETIDIHGGGRDLVFPHHENEIAQTEALTGKRFANYWIHNGLIKVNNQKMSKSLNNSILLKDLLNEYNFEVIKFTLESNVYRSDLNVIDGIFEEKEKQLYSIYKTLNTVDDNTSDLVVNVDSDEYKEVVNNFETDMNDDFNYSLAVSRIYDYMSRINKLITEKNYQEALNISAAIRNVYKVIGLFSQNPSDYINEIRNKFLRVNNITEEYINDLIIKRKEY